MVPLLTHQLKLVSRGDIERRFQKLHGKYTARGTSSDRPRTIQPPVIINDVSDSHRLGMRTGQIITIIHHSGHDPLCQASKYNPT